MRKNFYKSLIFIIIFLLNLFIKPIYVLGKTKNKKPYVNARSAIAIDKDTGTVLFNQNGYEVIPMASTTKIMTSLVAIKHGDLDKKITISKRADRIGGSTVKYRAGEEITLRELLYGLMFKSGNDAAIAIAEGVGGSVEEFLKLMNEEAIRLGAINTHFETPHGLDKEYHYTTAYDLALITAAAKKNKVFNEIVGSKEIKKDKYKFTRDYNNINKLLHMVPECTGVKTGYTGKAGKCLVSAFNIKDKEIIVVTLNCTPRWKESKRIYEYVKENYDYEILNKKGDNIGSIKDKNNREISLYVKEDIVIPINKNEKYTYKINVDSNNLKDININKGTMLGVYEVLREGKVIYRVPIYNKESILNKKTIIDKIKSMIKK